ncbi:hypothetical protein HYV85_03580 [Candidatus Woesearchaeota archaeon]|nr:hypothetical protein [Candidatus Woesearchaeota archaeon]
MASAVAADGKNRDGKNGKNKKTYEPERCARCGTPVVETHCRVLCTNCGFMRDCNDQW